MMAKAKKTISTGPPARLTAQAKKPTTPARGSTSAKPTGSASAKPTGSASTRSAASASAKTKGTDKNQKKTPDKGQKKGSDKNQKKTKKPSIFKRMLTYFRNVRLEVKRTTWPTRSEVLNMSIIVIIALLFFGVLILIIDQIMVAVVNFLSQFKFGSNASNVTGAMGSLESVAQYAYSLLTGGK